MYISRRGDIVGPPVWKSTISPCLSKSELASLRLWQSECQQCTLSPLHHHTLTPPGYPPAPSRTRIPSNVKHDREPDLAQLLRWALSHRVSDSNQGWFHRGIIVEIQAKGRKFP